MTFILLNTKSFTHNKTYVMVFTQKDHHVQQPIQEIARGTPSMPTLYKPDIGLSTSESPLVSGQWSY